MNFSSVNAETSVAIVVAYTYYCIFLDKTSQCHLSHTAGDINGFTESDMEGFFSTND